jgi:hypothetical protein
MQVPLKAVALKVSVNYKRSINSYLLRLYLIPMSRTLGVLFCQIRPVQVYNILDSTKFIK